MVNRSSGILQDAGRDRDDAAGERYHPGAENDEVAVPGKPPFGPVEVLFSYPQPPAVAQH